MKKIVSCLLAVAMAFSMGIVAFAEDFTPSVTKKPVPELVPVTPPENGFANTIPAGAIVTVTIVDSEDDSIIYGYATLADDSTWHAIVVTPVSRKDDEGHIVADESVSDEIKAILNSSFAQVNEINTLDDLTTSGKAFTDYLKDKGIDADVKDFVVRDLFDITIYGPDAENLRAKLLAHENVTFTFNLGVEANDIVVGMHQPLDAEYIAENGMNEGDWEVVHTTNNGDHTVSITLTNLSPVLFAIKAGGTGTITPSGNHVSQDTGDTFNSGAYIAAMVVAACGLVVLTKKKKSN